LSSLHRVSHKVGWFVGTIYFVIIQAVFVLLWLFWNAFAVQSFDPSVGGLARDLRSKEKEALPERQPVLSAVKPLDREAHTFRNHRCAGGLVSNKG
jgi:hypothetical protein